MPSMKSDEREKSDVSWAECLTGIGYVVMASWVVCLCLLSVGSVLVYRGVLSAVELHVIGWFVVMGAGVTTI